MSQNHLDLAIAKEKRIYGKDYEFVQELKQAAIDAEEMFSQDELELYASDWRKKNAQIPSKD